MASRQRATIWIARVLDPESRAPFSQFPLHARIAQGAERKPSNLRDADRRCPLRPVTASPESFSNVGSDHRRKSRGQSIHNDVQHGVLPPLPDSSPHLPLRLVRHRSALGPECPNSTLTGLTRHPQPDTPDHLPDTSTPQDSSHDHFARE